MSQEKITHLWILANSLASNFLKAKFPFSKLSKQDVVFDRDGNGEQCLGSLQSKKQGRIPSVAIALGYFGNIGPDFGPQKCGWGKH